MGSVMHYADDDLGKAAELADLWISMVPDFPPDSDCHWECIVHGLNRTSCDPVYAPIVMPCSPETVEYICQSAELCAQWKNSTPMQPETGEYICQSFECEPVWDGGRMHCGYYGNVTGHTHVITDGSWERYDQ